MSTEVSILGENSDLFPNEMWDNVFSYLQVRFLLLCLFSP